MSATRCVRCGVVFLRAEHYLHPAVHPCVVLAHPSNHRPPTPAA
jgi:hypothetical protein